MARPVEGWLELDDPWDPSQPKPVYDSVILKPIVVLLQ